MNIEGLHDECNKRIEELRVINEGLEDAVRDLNAQVERAINVLRQLGHPEYIVPVLQGYIADDE